MARTYSNTPVLSKIKTTNGNTYYLKDADARAILDAINADVYELLKATVGAVADGGDHLATAGNIKEYVDNIAEIGFDVVILNELPTASESTYATYHNNIVLIADATSTTGAYVEYVILRSGTAGSYTYAWEKIGTTQVDLNGYLKNVSYVDGTHTLQETKNVNGVETTTDVHTFGDLADADTASGSTTLETADSATFSEGAATVSADYTPAGTIAVTLNELTQTDTAASLTKGDYTPEGSISVTLDQTSTTATLTMDDYTPAGTISSITVIDSVGSLPTKAEDTFDAGALPSLGTASTATFVNEGITAAVGTGDDAETLIFTAASTATAVTAQGAFNAGSLPSFTEGAFTQGALPTTKTVTPSFTGTKAEDILVTAVNYDKASVDEATFTGATATNILVTAVNYDKATANGATASFTGTAATITSTGTATGSVTLTKTAKTIAITVEPDNE